jgi:hypothetical protein
MMLSSYGRIFIDYKVGLHEVLVWQKSDHKLYLIYIPGFFIVSAWKMAFFIHAFSEYILGNNDLDTLSKT